MSIVYGFDLYIKRDLSVSASDSIGDRLTFDGRPGAIFNGIPDWLYEEEILSTNAAHWWSDSGRQVLYMQLNDTMVMRANIPVYGDGSFPYTSNLEIPYPKPGFPNPSVRMIVVDASNARKKITLTPPTGTVDLNDHYVTAAAWIGEQSVLVIFANRLQTHAFFCRCQTQTGACAVVYDYRSPSGWVEFFDAPIVAESKRFFLIRMPQRVGVEGEFKHVALITLPDDEKARGVATFLTFGSYDVDHIVAYHPQRNLTYVVSALDKPYERHLYEVKIVRVNRDGTNMRCLSCDSDCTYASAQFSHNAEHFVLTCLGPGVPTAMLYSIDRGLQPVKVLDDNAYLAELVEKTALPKIHRFTIPVNENQLDVQLTLPIDYQENELWKYPLLVHVYGGPGSQMVSTRFKVDFDNYLASAHDIIVASIDGRGAGYHGEKFMHTVYKKLGTVEIQDQIAATKYLIDTLDYVDASRVAIWGWSYGGFVTTSVLASGTTQYRCGIAVAPVSDWRFYDSAYTERFISLPLQNAEGYRRAAVNPKVARIRESGAEFLLVHGTGDDNVHYDNTAQLVRALDSADVRYSMHVYTDEAHSLYGVQSNLYHMLTRFLLNKCFPLSSTCSYCGANKKGVPGSVSTPPEPVRAPDSL